MIDMVKTGKRISNSRKNKNLTQEELASRLGVTPQAVSRWERGNAMPDIEFLMPLSAMLDIPVEDLLTGSTSFKEPVNPAEPPITEPPKIGPVEAYNLISADELRIFIAEDFFLDNPGFEEAMTDNLERITTLRRELALKYGFVMPIVRVNDDKALKNGAYKILLRDKDKGGGRLYKQMCFTYPEQNGFDKQPEGIADIDYNGCKILWTTNDNIKPEQQDKWHPFGVLITGHFKKIVIENFDKLLTRDTAKQLADHTAKKYPITVAEAVPVKISYGQLAKLLSGILKENKPIRDMYTILHFICEARDVSDIDALVKEIAAEL